MTGTAANTNEAANLMTEVYRLFNGMVASLTLFPEALSLPSAEPDPVLDGKLLLLSAAVIFVLTWVTRLALVTPMVRLFLPLSDNTKPRFVSSAMEFLVYGFSFCYGLMVVPSQPWVWPSANWWTGSTKDGPELVRDDLRAYYIIYTARYVMLLASIFFEKKRKDFLAMLAHHVVTVLLCSLAYIAGYSRFGVVVMVVFDFADVPLHAAKMFKYLSLDPVNHKMAKCFKWLCNRAFELFAISFLVTRVGMYSYICWSACFEHVDYKGVKEWACLACMFMLFLLQMYWVYLLIIAVSRSLKGDVDDQRSDDESEEAEPTNNFTNGVTDGASEGKKRE